MKIALDARPLCARRTHGIPGFVRGILGAIARADRENEYLLYADRDFCFEAPPSFRWTKRVGGRLPGTAWLLAAAPIWIRRDRADVFWGTQHVLPPFVPRGTRVLLTVHDLVHRRYPGTMEPFNLWVHRLFVGPSARRADHIMVASESTARDVRELEGVAQGRIAVVGPAAAGQYSPMHAGEARGRLCGLLGEDADRPYVLAVGTLEPRKNFGVAIEAFARVADALPRHKLMIAGATGWKNGRLLSSVLEGGMSRRVRLLGYVPDELLPALYAASDCFVLPSLYEGFGIPVAEAMAAGTPVITSDIPSLREVAGDAGIAFPLGDPGRLALEMVRVCTDQDLRRRLISRGLVRAKSFSYDASAARFLDILRGLGGGGGAGSRVAA